MATPRVPVLVPPQFAEFMQEFFGDKRSVLWPDANILSQSYALDNAFSIREIDGLEGDFIYVDSDSTGVAYIKFNGQAFPWIPIRPNFSISGFPIKRAWIKNLSAQAGKQLNLFWGYGARIIPPNQDISNIGSVTNISNPVPIKVSSAGNLQADDAIVDAGASFGIGFSVPGVAGQTSIAVLVNPIASGKTLLVDMVANRSSPASRWSITEVASNFGGADSGRATPIRKSAASAGAAKLFTGNGVAEPLNPGMRFVDANQSIQVRPKGPWIIASDRALALINIDANTQIDGSFEWREV